MPKKPHPTKKYDGKLHKAFVDLNKIFILKDLRKKFKIPEWKISKYKKKEKLKPFDKEKRKEILKFYKKLIKAKNLEDFQYGYDIRKYRIRPVLGVTITKIRELEEEIGLKWLAYRIRVKPETIKRWKKRRVIKIRPKYVERIHKIHTKTIKPFSAKFLLSGIKTDEEGRKIEYTYFRYVDEIRGTKKSIFRKIGGREKEKTIIKSLIWEKRKKPSITQAKEIIKDLKDLRYFKRRQNMRKYFSRNLREVTTFIHSNFKKTELKTLLKQLRKYEK